MEKKITAYNTQTYLIFLTILVQSFEFWFFKK